MYAQIERQVNLSAQKTVILILDFLSAVENLVCASILKNPFSMTSPMAGIYRNQKSALSVTSSRLYFILALAILYVTAQGIAIVAAGRRR